MENPITNYSEVTDDKVAFFEAQAQNNLQFRLESKKLLAEQAIVTLNWLFALAVTPAGYVFTKAADIEWWIAVPALLCSLSSGGAACYLFQNALKMRSVYPVGNEPKNLINDRVMSGELKWIRLAEVCNLQERIDLVIEQNNLAGRAINNSRMAIVLITGLSVVVLGILYLLNLFFVC